MTSPLQDASAGQASAGRAFWMLTVLTLLYLVSMVDRGIISLLLPMIKKDMGLTDFQMGLLHGPAFAIFFCVMGLPLGYLIDRLPRRPLIFAGVLVWTAATAITGFAHRFWQLLGLRCALGAGEAVLSPAAYSILPDIFPPRRLGLALAVFGSGATFGNGVAFALGGFILSLVPAQGLTWSGGHMAVWQVVFLIAAIPALLAAPLIFTVPEPLRRDIRLGSDGAASQPLREFLATRRHFLLCLVLGFGFLSFSAYAWLSWLPTYLSRVEGMAMKDVAHRIALLALIAVPSGQLLFGAATDWLYARGRSDAAFIVFGLVAILFPLCAALALLSHDAVLIFCGVAGVFICFGYSALATAISLTTPNMLRGRVSAIFLLVSNLIGVAGGPLVVGMVTDFYFRDELKLGLSMLLTVAVGGTCACLALLSGRRALRQAALSNVPAFRQP